MTINKNTNEGTILFQRERGKAKMYPGTLLETKVEVPPTETMLGLLSRNLDVQDGDRFAEDGFVYNQEGAKTRKWFSYMQGWNHFWAPVLDNPARLEAVYHKVKLRSDARYKRLWDHIQKIIDTTKQSQNKWKEKSWIVHAQPTFSQHQQDRECWAYDIHYRDFDNGVPSYSMSWVDIPKKFLHLELGNELYRLEHIAQGDTFRYGLEQVLNASLIKYLKNKYPDWQKMPVDTLFELRINGRHYVYQLLRNRYGAIVLEKHVWAGENYHIVELT